MGEKRDVRACACICLSAGASTPAPIALPDRSRAARAGSAEMGGEGGVEA